MKRESLTPWSRTPALADVPTLPVARRARRVRPTAELQADLDARAGGAEAAAAFATWEPYIVEADDDEEEAA